MLNLKGKFMVYGIPIIIFIGLFKFLFFADRYFNLVPSLICGSVVGFVVGICINICIYSMYEGKSDDSYRYSKSFKITKSR
jgi:hypothetical protein